MHKAVPTSSIHFFLVNILRGSCELQGIDACFLNVTLQNDIGNKKFTVLQGDSNKTLT